MGLMQTWRSLRRMDQQRHSVPGEHLMTFGVAAALARWGRRAPSPLLRAAAWGASGLLLWRAASGRDGPVARLRGR